MGCMGLLPLLRALAPLGGGRLVTPGPLHMVAGAASGAALALLLRHQLLQALQRKGYPRTSISRSAVDLEAGRWVWGRRSAAQAVGEGCPHG